MERMEDHLPNTKASTHKLLQSGQHVEHGGRGGCSSISKNEVCM